MSKNPATKCPFCQQAPSTTTERGAERRLMASCATPGCVLYGLEFLLAKWNTRAPSTDVATAELPERITLHAANGSAHEYVRAPSASVGVATPDLSSRVAAAFPESWLDNLLTGPSAVLGKGPWGCLDIERLLAAVKERVIIAVSNSEPDKLVDEVQRRMDAVVAHFPSRSRRLDYD